MAGFGKGSLDALLAFLLQTTCSVGGCKKTASLCFESPGGLAIINKASDGFGY